ncbi:hypothetical protein [Streptomyces sp. NPDC001070]
MRRPGPALRVALLGTAAAVVGFLLLGAWLGLHARAYTHARDRATAVADGLVIEDGIGESEDIRVRWTDRAGREHVQRFEVYATGRYARGHRFPVAYAPGQADPRGFPADPGETATEDDLLVPVAFAGLIAAFFCAAWAVRGLRFRRATRSPGRPMTATVLHGTRVRAVAWQPGTTWLALADADSPAPAVLWQRVMWHPALGDLPGPVGVTVRGGGRRPAVADLPDGTRLVPLGRPRRRAPRHVLLYEHTAVRADLRDAFVLPAGAETLTGRPWWRPGALAAVVGAGAGAAASLPLTGGTPVAAVGFALSGAALVLASWALFAPQP